MKDHNYYVYMLTNKDHQVMYIGMTNDLARRMHEHQNHLIPGFTSRYNLDKLVYYEHTHDVDAAIAREKQLKGWTRAKKNALLEAINPTWQDLSGDWQHPERSFAALRMTMETEETA